MAVQKDRAASKGAGGEGFIHCFSCWDAAGWEVEPGGEGFIHCFNCWDAAEWEVEAEEVFKLWISSVGLCLVIQWRLDCTALRMLWSCFGLVKPMDGAV